MTSRTYVFVAWLPSIACMAALWLLSSLPQVPGPELFPHQDKVQHLVAYAVLAALFMHALRRTRPRGAARTLWLVATVLTAAYGAIDEWHQSFVPGRDATLGDLLADAAGGALGAALAGKFAATPSRR